MKTLTFEAEVGSDGKLRLELPTSLPPGRVEGVVVVQPTMHKQPAISGFDSLEGMLAGKVPKDFDADAELRAIRAEWESDMDEIG